MQQKKKNIEDPIKKDRINVDFGKQGGYIIAVLLIYFIFFGMICIYYGRNINQELIWLYRTIFEVYFGAPALLLFIISLFLTYKEDVYHYGIKNSLWLNFFIFLFAFFWYWILKGFSWNPFIYLFLNFQGYLTFLVLILLELFGVFCGWKIKKIVKKQKSIENLTKIKSKI